MDVIDADGQIREADFGGVRLKLHPGWMGGRWRGTRFQHRKFCGQLTLTVADKKRGAQWNGSERVNLRTLAESRICNRALGGSTCLRATLPARTITCRHLKFPVRRLRRTYRRPRIGGPASTSDHPGRDARDRRLREASVPSIRLVPLRRSPRIGGGCWLPSLQLLESSGRMSMTWCVKSSAGCIRTRTA